MLETNYKTPNWDRMFAEEYLALKRQPNMLRNRLNQHPERRDLS